MTSLAAVHGVLPPHRYPQDKITEAFAELVGVGADRVELLRRIHANARVDSRSLGQMAIEVRSNLSIILPRRSLE